MKPDIATHEDIRSLVDAFYTRMEEDPLLGRFFADVDMPGHLPKMYAFWERVLWGTGTYRGAPFPPHERLDGLDLPHFGQWLSRWHATVDARFAGPNAEEVKDRAGDIARAFQMRLGLLPFPTF